MQKKVLLSIGGLVVALGMIAMQKGYVGTLKGAVTSTGPLSHSEVRSIIDTDSSSVGTITITEMRSALVKTIKTAILQSANAPIDAPIDAPTILLYDLDRNGRVEKNDIGLMIGHILQIRQCGNGQVSGNEQCDDRNTFNGDGCSNQCTTEAGYSCDILNGMSVCRSCGNGRIEGPEQCDDGTNNALTCVVPAGQASCSFCSSATCTLATQQNPCGNGSLDAGEQCDQGNGNRTNGDGCSATCQQEQGYRCGNAVPSVCTSYTDIIKKLIGIEDNMAEEQKNSIAIDFELNFYYAVFSNENYPTPLFDTNEDGIKNQSDFDINNDGIVNESDVTTMLDLLSTVVPLP